MDMKSYNIAVIGGDGTGPEVVREAVKVLDAAGRQFDLKLNYTPYDLGGERYLRTQEALPDSVVEELRRYPAILLGAIGHPGVKPGILEKGILLRLREGAGSNFASGGIGLACGSRCAFEGCHQSVSRFYAAAALARHPDRHLRIQAGRGNGGSDVDAPLYRAGILSP